MALKYDPKTGKWTDDSVKQPTGVSSVKPTNPMIINPQNYANIAGLNLSALSGGIVSTPLPFQQQSVTAPVYGPPKPTTPAPIQGPPKPTTPVTAPTPSVAGYYRVGNDVYDPASVTASNPTGYISYDEATKRGIVPLLAGIPQKSGGTTQPPVPTPTAPPKPQDFSQYYQDLAGVQNLQKQQQEAEAAKVAARAAQTKAIEDQTAAIGQASKLFNDLFDSETIKTSRADSEKAFAELSEIDARQAKEVNDFKTMVQQAGDRPSWAANAQIGIINERFNVERAGKAAMYAIAANKLENAKEYATNAYNAGIKGIEMRMSLVKDSLKYAQDLSVEEKAEYDEVLKQAQDLLKEKKSERKESLDLYLSLAQKGISGLRPDMSISEMTELAGPELVRQAKAEQAQAAYKTYSSSTSPKIKEATAAQNLAAGFATRIQDAAGIIDGLDSYISQLGTAGFYAQKALPNFARSSQMQQLDQASRNFVNAVLRRESGAAISPAEFENAELQYFPQPGDKPEVLAQKKANRQRALENLARDAGPAFTMGTQTTTDPQTELDDDISSLGSRFGTREQLIASLVPLYTELTPEQIAKRVYTLIPDKK